MKFLSTRAHGTLDYLTGAVLLVAPFMLGFADGGPAQRVPMVLGAGVIAYSLLTRYELGAIKLIPMPVHLVLMRRAALFWQPRLGCFGFSACVWVPHVVFELLELGLSFMTHPVPETDLAISGQPGE